MYIQVTYSKFFICQGRLSKLGPSRISVESCPEHKVNGQVPLSLSLSLSLLANYTPWLKRETSASSLPSPIPGSAIWAVSLRCFSFGLWFAISYRWIKWLLTSKCISKWRHLQKRWCHIPTPKRMLKWNPPTRRSFTNFSLSGRSRMWWRAHVEIGIMVETSILHQPPNLW